MKFKVGDRVILKATNDLCIVWEGNAGTPDNYGDRLPVRIVGVDYGSNKKNCHSWWFKKEFRKLTKLEQVLL